MRPEGALREFVETGQSNVHVTSSHCAQHFSVKKCSVSFGLYFVVVIALIGGFFKVQDLQLQASSSSMTMKSSSAAKKSSTVVMVASDESIAVLKMNPESAIASDVLGGWHNPKEGSIIIDFNRTGRCPRPVLRGRLSGPALVMVEWKYLDDSTTTVQGNYQVPFSGTYYLEIIVLLCHGWKRTTDFQGICLEDPVHHRVTELNTSIQVSRAQKGAHEMYWVPNPRISNATSTAIQPLYTRFQPQGCKSGPERQPSEDQLERCHGSIDLSRFTPYSLQWDTDELKQKIVNTTSKICLIGASHSGVMMNYLNKIVKRRVTVANSNFPYDVTRKVVEDLKRKGCQKIVIGVGQWSAGWPEDEPTLFPAYETQMSTLLENIQDIGGITIFLRSIHYNAIGDKIGGCPPADWRSPPVIDGYNRILKRVSKNFGVEFIDTNAIIGPVWDSAPDWCHYRNEAGEKDALYIAGRVLGLL
jgi:hypothetical protein